MNSPGIPFVTGLPYAFLPLSALGGGGGRGKTGDDLPPFFLFNTISLLWAYSVRIYPFAETSATMPGPTENGASTLN
jgi:hypothetical protein